MFKFFGCFFQLGYIFLYGIGFVILLFLHQTANFSSQFLAFLQVLVKLLLRLAPCLVKSQYAVNSFLRTGKMFFLQSLDYPFSLFTDKFKCKHIFIF